MSRTKISRISNEFSGLSNDIEINLLLSYLKLFYKYHLQQDVSPTVTLFRKWFQFGSEEGILPRKSPMSIDLVFLGYMKI